MSLLKFRFEVRRVFLIVGIASLSHTLALPSANRSFVLFDIMICRPRTHAPRPPGEELEEKVAFLNQQLRFPPTYLSYSYLRSSTKYSMWSILHVRSGSQDEVIFRYSFLVNIHIHRIHSSIISISIIFYHWLSIGIVSALSTFLFYYCPLSREMAPTTLYFTPRYGC